VFKSKHVTDHNLLEDVHEEFLQIPSQINLFLCNRPDEALKASRRQSNTVRTARSISIQHGVGFQKSPLLGKSLQVIRTTWQHVRTLSSIQNILVFRSNVERSYSKDRPEARPSSPDMDLIKIELRYFWKDIAEDYPDVANFRPDARQSETESQLV